MKRVAVTTWKVVPSDELVPTALEIAGRLAAQPPLALRTTTALIREGRRVEWDAAVEREYGEMAKLAGGEENIAAITKFFEPK